MYIHVYIGICTCVNIHAYTCTYVYIRICIHICVWTITGRQHGYTMHLQTPTPDIKSSPPLFNPSLHMSVCMYRHMYVHIYIYIYIYTYICTYVCMYLKEACYEDNMCTLCFARIHCLPNWPITGQQRPHSPRTHGSTGATTSVACGTPSCTGHSP